MKIIAVILVLIAASGDSTLCQEKNAPMTFIQTTQKGRYNEQFRIIKAQQGSKEVGSVNIDDAKQPSLCRIREITATNKKVKDELYHAAFDELAKQGCHEINLPWTKSIEETKEYEELGAKWSATAGSQTKQYLYRKILPAQNPQK